MVSAISFTAVIESKFFHVESGLIALAITYALTMSNLLNSILSSFIETEKELVSVERIADYIENIPAEESNQEVENVDRFLFCRNAVGQIDFTCVSMRYAAGLPLALANVSYLQITPIIYMLRYHFIWMLDNTQLLLEGRVPDLE
jgi:ATP-binding cassette subfamily C (CFTR/MRP) protein 10